MPAYGYEFYLLVVNSISHEWAQRTSEISSWPLEDKIHIHAQACNILYIINRHDVGPAPDVLIHQTYILKKLVNFTWTCKIVTLISNFFKWTTT